MCPRLFSSLVMLALIKAIGGDKDSTVTDEEWAGAMETEHGQELQEQPAIFLTEKEDDRARVYLALYKKSGINIADEATRAIRQTHVAEILDFLNTTQDDSEARTDHGPKPEEQVGFLSNYKMPTSFDEWYIVASIWRLTRIVAHISYQDAAFGTGDCCIGSLPKEWVEKLNECMEITDASAVIPAAKGPNLPLRRRHLESILPASHDDNDLSGYFDGILIDVWCQILLLHRERLKPGRTLMIPPYSLEAVTETPIGIAMNAMSVNDRIDMILIPRIIKEHDHCILAVAYPQSHSLDIYDSLGSKSTKVLQKDSDWYRQDPGDPQKDVWQVTWIDCPLQGGECASVIFMFINAMCVILDQDPADRYGPRDTLFLRRFIAAVICIGRLPDNVSL